MLVLLACIGAFVSSAILYIKNGVPDPIDFKDALKAYLGYPIVFAVTCGFDSLVKLYISLKLFACAYQYYDGRRMMGKLGEEEFKLAPGFLWTMIICAVISILQSILLAGYVIHGFR